MGLRAAVVGTGNVAGVHVESLRACPVPVDLVAAADTSVTALTSFADRHGIEGRHLSLAELLASEQPDVVHLCTPPAGHMEQAIACLEAGASVVCEKPPVLSLAEYDAVQQAEERTGRHFMPVYQQRVSSSSRHVKRLLDSGAFGRPLLATCHTFWYREGAYYDIAWRRGWSAGGGPTVSLGVHQVDLLAYLLGEWEAVSAMAARLDRDVETEDVSCAHLSFANGAVASVVNSAVSPREESSVRIDCRQATVELSHLYGYGAKDWRITPAPGVSESKARGWAFPEPDVPSSHATFVAEAYTALAEGRRPPAAGRVGRVALEIATATYASALSGRPVRRADLRPGHPSYHRLPGDIAAAADASWAVAPVHIT